MYPVYQIPGDTAVYQVPHSEKVSCLSLFPRHKDNGILSNTPDSLLITNERSTGSTTGATVAVIIVSVLLLIIAILFMIFCIYKCKYCIIIIM